MSAENHLVSIERRITAYERMIESMNRTLVPDAPALIAVKRCHEIAKNEWLFWIRRKVEAGAEQDSTKSASAR